MNLIAIQPHLVAHIWADLCDGMEGLAKQSMGLWNPDSIRDKCATGDWLLFCMFEDGQPVVSLVVDIRQGEDSRIFDVGFCWGTRVDEWIEDIYAAFTRMARECGCDGIAFNGRPGWRKLAKQFDFTLKSVTYYKGLT